MSHPPSSNTPVAPPDAGEPKTPMWLPALGAALFLAAGLAWAVWPSDEPFPASGAPPLASAAPK